MDIEQVFNEIREFSNETHGSTSYNKEELFVLGQEPDEFAPLKFLIKKIDGLESKRDFKKCGFIVDSYDLMENPRFQRWFEWQFSRKLTRKAAKNINIIHMPDNRSIFKAVESINKCYDVLRKQQIILNNKNLPVQLGEWYAKFIFGLLQKKSTSQRGFDFQLSGEAAEVRVEWGEFSSPKGVKVKKSLVELSKYCIIIYVAQNLMIREICFLDSDFVLRKFAGKGHTIFLKDSDVSQYFLSKSNRYDDKVVNKTALLKFASPTLAMRIAERFH